MVLPDRIELSTSPLPMECSTTELRQHAGIRESAQKGPTKAADPCHKAPSCASARAAPGVIKMRQNQRGTPAYASIGSVAGRSGSRFPRPAPPAPLSGDHDLEFDDFAGVTPLRCHLPILAAADRMLAPGIGDCSDGGRNTIYSDSGEASRSAPRGDKAMPDIPRPLRQSSQCMHFAHRVFAPVIRTG